MPPARYCDAGGLLPTCTARASWPGAVFALPVTRHGGMLILLGRSVEARMRNLTSVVLPAASRGGILHLLVGTSEIDVRWVFALAGTLFLLFSLPR